MAASAISAMLFLILMQGCDKGRKADTGQGELMTVDVAYPTVDSVVLRKSYPGHLAANSRVDLVARVNGYLTAKYVAGGTFVKKGTLLFSIEPQQYADMVKQAKADLETAKATNIYAQQHYEAVSKALESDAVSKMEVIQAKSALDQSVAQIASAEAALRTAETNLGYCSIRAPFDGVVTDATADVGAYLAGAGAPVVLASILDESSLVAVFSIEDKRYLDLLSQKAQGNDVDFSRIPVNFNEKLPHDYTADLTYMSPFIDSSTGTLTVKAKIKNPYGELKAGMYATVNLPYGYMDKAILVKDASISTDQRGKYLYTVTDSGTVRYTPVEVGQVIADTLRVIESGLTPKDRYVTRALMKVRPGMKVNPVIVK